MHQLETAPPRPSDDVDVNPAASGNRSALTYVALTFALAIPFWVAGGLSNLQLLPALPVSALGFVCPLGAATILVYRENGRAGVMTLLKRSFDVRRVEAKIWYVPTILLMPCIMVVSFGALHLLGVYLPDPQFSLVTALTLFGIFFIAALAEELGWSGYAIEPLQDRFGALWAALLLGVVWAVWHFIPLLEAQRSLSFIGWWSLGTVATRVIITWLYNNTGRSVFVAALFHAMINLTWQLFPIDGSFYDPHVTGVITAVVAVVVVIMSGPRTFVRGHSARRSIESSSIDRRSDAERSVEEAKR